MAQSRAYLGPKPLYPNPKQDVMNGVETSDVSQDREQTPAPELRRDMGDPAGWPKKMSYVVSRQHITLEVNTDGRGKEAARSDNGPKNKGKFDSNRSGRIPRNTWTRRGNTG